MRPYEQPEMPFDTDTERAVLATLMRYNEKYAEVGDTIDADMFYGKREKAIWRTVTGIIESGKLTDINSMADYARRHDVGFQLERQDILEVMQTPSRATLSQDIARLRMMERQRTTWMVLQKAAQNIVDPMADMRETVDTALAALSEVQQQITYEGIASFEQAIDELTEIVEGNRAGNKTALQTGYRIFDKNSLLRPHTLTVIAAFTSVGKSALALNVAVNVARTGAAVAYYSLEMGKAELASRAISAAVQVPANIIMNKSLTDEQFERYKYYVTEYRRLPIHIDERSTVSFDSTIGSIRTLTRKRDIKLAIIDYLQIYTQTDDNVEASLAQMARQAKNIAKELGIAVILLSQLNRSGKKPALNMMRGSGQIEESADNIVLIDRPKAYDPDDKEDLQEADLILAKGRGVGTDKAEVNFNKKYTTFLDKHYAEDIREEEETELLPF